MKYVLESREFKNREEMLNYEKQRDAYYKNWVSLSNSNLFGFYKLLFLELFHPKYRATKKEYNSYMGGWFRDENGFIHTNNLAIVSGAKNGEIIITDL